MPSVASHKSSRRATAPSPSPSASLLDTASRAFHGLSRLSLDLLSNPHAKRTRASASQSLRRHETRIEDLVDPSYGYNHAHGLYEPSTLERGDFQEPVLFLSTDIASTLDDLYLEPHPSPSSPTTTNEQTAPWGFDDAPTTFFSRFLGSSTPASNSLDSLDASTSFDGNESVTMSVAEVHRMLAVAFKPRRSALKRRYGDVSSPGFGFVPEQEQEQNQVSKKGRFDARTNGNGKAKGRTSALEPRQDNMVGFVGLPTPVTMRSRTRSKRDHDETYDFSGSYVDIRPAKKLRFVTTPSEAESQLRCNTVSSWNPPPSPVIDLTSDANYNALYEASPLARASPFFESGSESPGPYSPQAQTPTHGGSGGPFESGRFEPLSDEELSATHFTSDPNPTFSGSMTMAGLPRMHAELLYAHSTKAFRAGLMYEAAYVRAIADDHYLHHPTNGTHPSHPMVAQARRKAHKEAVAKRLGRRWNAGTREERRREAKRVAKRKEREAREKEEEARRYEAMAFAARGTLAERVGTIKLW